MSGIPKNTISSHLFAIGEIVLTNISKVVRYVKDRF